LLHKDELALIEGKRVTADGTWYLVRITDAKWSCWVHGSTFELHGDKNAVGLSHVVVPESSKVPAASGVKANRSKNSVTISWSAAPSAPELEYLIEVIICTKDDYLLEVAYSTMSTSFKLTDKRTCSGTSFGTVRVANKLGYSGAVKIPWP